jgi:uncharacterized membrane protein
MKYGISLFALMLLIACNEEQTDKENLSSEFSVTINKPLAEVFEYAANPENLTEWGEGIQKVEVTSPGSLQVGTVYVITNKVGGRVQEFTSEVTALIPNELFIFKTGGSFPYRSTRTFRVEQGSTIVTEKLRAGRATGLKRIATPMIMRFATKSHHTSLKNMKDILEKRP